MTVPFTERHFFGPRGEIIPVGKKTLHVEHVMENPTSFGFKNREDAEGRSDQSIFDHIMKRGFIRAEYYPPMGSEESHQHNLSYETKNAKPEHFNPALRALHDHYKKNPEMKFEINLLGNDWNSDDRLLNHIKDVTGGNNQLSSLSDIEKFVGMKSEEEKPTIRVKRIKRNEIQEPTKIKLGTMAQGNMTDAEYNFWRRKGLGDSYQPRKSFKTIMEQIRNNK